MPGKEAKLAKLYEEQKKLQKNIEECQRKLNDLSETLKVKEEAIYEAENEIMISYIRTNNLTYDSLRLLILSQNPAEEEQIQEQTTE